MIDAILNYLFFRKKKVGQVLGWVVYIPAWDWSYGLYRTKHEAEAIKKVVPIACTVLPLSPMAGGYVSVGWGVLTKEGKVYDVFDSQYAAESVAEAEPGMTSKQLFVCKED
jgi:hypothetical protein